uniref:SEFIR domain-containing protein n=1 Tax=Graphocephala atropunctata TaxID=36148 RepID=A0A1B6KDR1_9HEMI
MIPSSKQYAVVCLLVHILKLDSFCDSLNTDTATLSRPGKNLCYQRQDVNCSNQVTSEFHNATCLMRYINATSKACTESEFTGGVDLTESYGSVNLTPYAWFNGGFIFPTFNITFRNIKWKRLRFRFVKVGEDSAQICREFVVSDDVDPSSIISFDCLWGNGATAEEFYKFQFMLTTRSGYQLLYTYLLQVPADSDVESNIPPHKYRLFTLLEQTALPQIRMKFLVPPTWLNVSRVNVSLLYHGFLNGRVRELGKWTIDMLRSRPGYFISTETFDISHTSGYYYFNTSFESPYCTTECTVSSTPKLFIPGPDRDPKVWIALVLYFILVFGVAGLFLFRSEYYKKIIDGPEKLPVVLFIYESSYPSHIETIYKFREFLQDNCYIEPKLDLIDISKTDSMNPWQWYYKTFEEADYVIVFASPDESTEKGIHEDNVYHNLHTYALKLLNVCLLHKSKLKFSVASVKLPGCSWKTLPPEAQIVEKRFSLPEQLSHMFKFLNVPPVKNGSSLLVSALQQPRSAPQFFISRPLTPLKLPFDAGDFDLDSEEKEDSEVRNSIIIKNFQLRLDGQSTSEDEEEDVHQDLPIVGFKF